MEYWQRIASLGLDAESPDDVATLLHLVGDELAEVGGRTDERCATQIGEPPLDLMIGEAGVDLLVELLDDHGRRGLRCTDAGGVSRDTTEPASWSRQRAAAAGDDPAGREHQASNSRHRTALGTGWVGRK